MRYAPCFVLFFCIKFKKKLVPYVDADKNDNLLWDILNW